MCQFHLYRWVWPRPPFTLAGKPVCVSCINVLSACLGEYECSALLLRPLGLLLTFWEGLLWILTLIGSDFERYLFSIMATVVALYFHFQLLTNLASIAERFDCPEHRRILTLRTVRTVLITLFALPVPWTDYQVLAVGMAAAHIVVAFWLCVVLFSVRKSLSDAPECADGEA